MDPRFHSQRSDRGCSHASGGGKMRRAIVARWSAAYRKCRLTREEMIRRNVAGCHASTPACAIAAALFAAAIVDAIAVRARSLKTRSQSGRR